MIKTFLIALSLTHINLYYVVFIQISLTQQNLELFSGKREKTVTGTKSESLLLRKLAKETVAKPEKKTKDSNKIQKHG